MRYPTYNPPDLKLSREVQKNLRIGNFSVVESYMVLRPDDIMWCLDLLRDTFKDRWLMPHWFTFRDQVKQEMIEQNMPWGTLMAGLFGTPRWESY